MPLFILRDNFYLVDAPAFMLIDKRTKPTYQGTPHQQQSVSKRSSDDLKVELAGVDSNEPSGPEQKKQKTDTVETSTKDKEQEDDAFEQEFECGVCHEIMHKAIILQPCLHSFCRGCIKSWLKQYVLFESHL